MSVTDGNAQTTTTVYDAFGRVAQVKIGTASCNPAACQSFSYNADGTTASTIDMSGTTAYTYDHLGRVTQEALSNDPTPVTVSYDPIGNMVTYSDGGGTVTYGYDADNHATSLVEPSGATTTFGYNNNDARTTTTYPGGVTMTAVVDNSGRIAQISAANSSGMLYSDAYSYHNASTDTSLITSRVDQLAGVTTSYTYDSLNRLTNAANTHAGSTTASWLYCYDPAGNRTADSTTIGAACPTTPGPGSNTYTADPSGALTARNGSSTGFATDGNGNQTASLGAQTYANTVYNPFNQLTSITANGTTHTDSYTGTTNTGRTQQDSASYTNTLLGLTIQKDAGGGGTVDYTRDPSGTLVSERINGTSYHYLYDGTGSVIGLTNSSGQLVNTYTYDPYGNSLTKTEQVPNPYQYQASYLDTTGLYHLGARYYDPTLGRFTQLDPTGQDPGYTYAGNDPINGSDPTGELTEFCGNDGCISYQTTPTGFTQIAVVTKNHGFGAIDAEVFCERSTTSRHTSLF